MFKGKTKFKANGYSMSKYNPLYPHKNPQVEKKRKEFLRQGGGLSGLYDVSEKRTASFVREYRDFIPRKEIYKRDKRGWLVPVYKR